MPEMANAGEDHRHVALGGGDPTRPEKNLQVTEQMVDDKYDENDARERGDDFFPTEE